MASPSVDLTRISLGKRLLTLGVRPHVVSHLLSLPQKTTVNWFEQLTGYRTNRGPLKSGAIAYVKSREASRRLTVLCGIYCMIVGTDEVNAVSHLIRTIETYNVIFCGEIVDGTYAWMAVRDLNSGIIKYRYCSSCSHNYIYNLQSAWTRKCPFCKQVKKGRKKSSKPTHKTAAVA